MTEEEFRKGRAECVLDEVDHPPHYNAHPSGVECITVVEHMPFNLGNAVKYIWRAGLKAPDAVKDLEKALWYVEREIARLSPPTASCPCPSDRCGGSGAPSNLTCTGRTPGT